MAKNKPSIPKGTRDFGPEVMGKRLFIFENIRSTFQRYGYLPLETPSMENLSVLLGKYGEEGDRLIFKILNSGDFLSKTTPEDYEKGSALLSPKITEKGLRYDLTVPFARYVVMNRGTLNMPFKRYQMQPVWRADRPQKGRYREFYQCDADVVGTNSLICEAEIVCMVQEVFGKLGITDYTIKINNRKVLAGIAETVEAAGKETELCTAIDKLDKIGREKVEVELSERGFATEAIEKLAPVFELSGGTEEMIAQLKTWISSSENGKKGIEELEEVFTLLNQMEVDTYNVALDITLARGLTYYTGAIFEVKVNNVQIGSVSGGGRYENLTEVFGGKDMPGVGFSFGVDRMYDVMEELNLFPPTTQQSTQLLFANFGKAEEAYCLPLVHQVRQAGIAAEIYPDSGKKLNKQMDYANKKSIPYVALIGSQEMKSGKINLKNMETGDQELLDLNELTKLLS